jgi:hypothetical protein
MVRLFARLLVLLIVFNTAAAFGQETASEKLWRSYADEMVAFIAGTGSKVDGLQLLSVAQVADWSNDAHADYNRDVKWCDSIPKFGPMYQASGKTVTGEYRIYLESLNLPKTDPVKAKKVAAAKKAWKAAFDAENDTLKKVGDDWKAFQQTQQNVPANRRRDYDQWYASGYGRKVGAAQSDLTAKAQVYAQILNDTYQGYGTVADAVTEYANHGYQLQSQAPDGLKLDHRTCSMSPELKDVVERGKTQVNTNAYAHTLNITTSHHELHVSEWGVSGGAAFLGFIAVVAGGDYEHREVHESKRTFVLDVKFRNLEVVNFTRSKWFSPDVIALLNTNDVFVPGALGNADKLWGDNGSFRLLPVSAVVAYQPTLSITLDDSDYDYVLSKWNAGFALGFGPFVIAGKGHGSNEDTVWDDKSHTLTATFKTEAPYVIAVKNSVMPHF